jgi:hypothetical protein
MQHLSETYSYSVGGYEEERPLGIIGVDGRIILKWFLK